MADVADKLARVEMRFSGSGGQGILLAAAIVRLSEVPPEEIPVRMIKVVAVAVIVVHPAASPSSPSVRLTAFETEMMTKAAHGIYSQTIDSGSHANIDSSDVVGTSRKEKRQTAAIRAINA